MRFDASLVTASCASPLGPILLAATGRGLAGLWFEGQRHWPAASAGWSPDPAHAVLREACAQLQAYFAGRLQAFELPLDLQGGTPFQQAVWQAMQAIPRGGTCSYGALSERIGAPAAVRAVGAAVGRNPVSIVVPCHRVLGKAGALTGYAGGLDRKTALLRLEGVSMAHPRSGLRPVPPRASPSPPQGGTASGPAKPVPRQPRIDPTPDTPS